MIGIIIWIAIIVYIVIKCTNNAKKKQQVKPNVPRTQQVKPNVSRMQQVKPNVPQKHYPKGQLPQPKKTQQPQNNGAILQKAKENANQNFSNDTIKARGAAELDRIPNGEEIVKDKAKAQHHHREHEMHSHEAELRNQPGLDDYDTYHLIDEVQDLIVKGYDGNLSFERDFLAEATDMLNAMTQS